MVMRNKLYRVFDKYRELLKARAAKKPRGYGLLKKGNRTKNRLLDFYLKNSRWPNRRSANKTERMLGQRFENFVSKEAVSYDPQFRRIAFLTGRKTNRKRKHNVEEFKRQILEFIKTNGRAPMTHKEYVQVEGEHLLRQKLDYYTKNRNDMTLLGQVYDSDPCHRSGVPSKFRAIINAALDVEKPLIRLV